MPHRGSLFILLHDPFHFIEFHEGFYGGECVYICIIEELLYAADIVGDAIEDIELELGGGLYVFYFLAGGAGIGCGVFLFELGEYFVCAVEEFWGHAGHAGHLDTEAVTAATGSELAQEDDLIAGFFVGDVVVMHTG